MPQTNKWKIANLAILWTAVLLTNSQVLAGELYKWTDENGVVHYSEKPPEDRNVKRLNINQGKNFQSIPVNTPISLKPTQALRHILLVKPEDFWNQPNSDLVVTYYFGGDCVSPSSTNVIEAKQNHSLLFPSNGALSTLASKTFRSFNYNVTTTSNSKRKLNASRYNDSTLLSIEPVSLNYSVCAKDKHYKYKRDKRIVMGSSPSDFRSIQFNNRHVTIGVKWTLIDANSNEQLFQGTSFGSADHWNQDVSTLTIKTLQQAFINATTNIMSDQKLVDAIIKPNKIGKPKEKGILDSISDLFTSNAVNKTHFANVLAKVSPLKTLVVEHYASHGEWPANAHAIGLEPSSLTSESYIDAIEFDVDGTIIVSVNEERFSHSGVILLKPQQSMGGLNIEWTCLTDLDKGYYDERNCQSL